MDKITKHNVAREDIIIELQNVSKVYDGKTVVDGFNLYVKRGEFITFLGPSGCGKTTTLRMIAGFEIPSEGKIILNGEDINAIPVGFPDKMELVINMDTANKLGLTLPNEVIEEAAVFIKDGKAEVVNKD